MKRKLFLTLVLLCGASILGGGYLVVSIERSTGTLDDLIQLHRVEILREQMLIQIKKVQRDLTLKDTRHEREFGTLVSHVSKMSRTIDSCFSCHHNEEVTARLRRLAGDAEKYKHALSRVYTMRANTQRLRQEEDNAFRIGEEFIEEVDGMLLMTTVNLERRTSEVLERIQFSKAVLIIFTMLGPLLLIGLAALLFIKFTEPVSELLRATQKLKAGDLDYRIDGLRDEFGEVADSFNEMSGALKDLMRNMMRADQMVHMGELASGLAHEIKNPIAGIKLSIEVLLDEVELDEEYRELLYQTREQVQNMERLMRSLLNFAKPPKPDFQMEDLNGILDNAISNVELILHGQVSQGYQGEEVRIVREYDTRLPQVRADASQLQQIFLNLLLNGVDAMPGGGTLKVRTSMGERDGYFKVEISDTGEGIDPNVLVKVFDPFFTTKSKGTGLGLAVSKRLVEQHGGEITVRNNERSGATFAVWLPGEPSREVS